MGDVRCIDFYPANFLAGVAGMSAELIGVYWVVCSLLYESGGALRTDDARLKSLCGVNYRRLPGALRELVKLGKLQLTCDQAAGEQLGTGGAAVTNRRVSSELARAKQLSSSYRARGEQGGRPSKENNDLQKAEVSGDAANDADVDSTPKKPPLTRALLISEILDPEEEKKENIKRKKATAREMTPEMAAEFAIWWALYPCKDARATAEIAYKKARSKVGADVLLAGLRRYRGSSPLSWAHGATWLNAERWNDEPARGSTRWSADDDPNYRGLL